MNDSLGDNTYTYTYAYYYDDLGNYVRVEHSKVIDMPATLVKKQYVYDKDGRVQKC